MESKKIGEFIKIKRKEIGLTQEQLANKLFVTEKAISRWETGRGTPDISLLIPLANELGVTTSELLEGSAKIKDVDSINNIIEYVEINKKGKYNLPFKVTIVCYVISVLIFLTYLRLDYSLNFNINYFIKLLFTVISSIFIIIGNCIYSNNYVDKIKDKQKIRNVSNLITFIYYFILLFNMTIFARFNNVVSYNLIPFKSILEVISNSSLYSIIINILGNLIIFMPLEYFLIELFKLNNFKLNFIISFSIILLCEFIQYIFKIGVFDVDDIILCVSGMMIFYFIYNLFITKKK